MSVAGLQQQIKSLFILVFKAALSSLFNWGDLHARAHTLARVRRGRMDLSDRWDSSGRTARDNYLTWLPRCGSASYPLPIPLKRAASGHAANTPILRSLLAFNIRTFSPTAGAAANKSLAISSDPALFGFSRKPTG